ncbi:hypothetical protein JL107_17830 [Nakamurella flavida]|uniref:Uncharacterized protein n=1 Tax=Nakamurella flavida TaxID=363630 RepID=A0A938YLQ1_9ACTN|nr:hypothetical protein [Nakamurella flavida]MBM9478312.1 hypothetical protein [Nakamurella flavida]MDP9777517.1 hypothetical protein [Nakamurella flavida]
MRRNGPTARTDLIKVVRSAGSGLVGTGMAVARGSDVVGTVSSSAAEMVRARRDASAVARRRQTAARRRVKIWSAGAVVGAGGTAFQTVTLVSGFSGAAAAGLVAFVILLLWCLSGVLRSARDLRTRRAVVRQLPPPQPARPAVGSAVRPQMEQLSGYSDALRGLVPMIGLLADDPSVASLRTDIISAADAAERRLREQAAQLSSLLRARSAGGDAAEVAGVRAMVERLTAQVRDGVGGYGHLVAATAETVAATHDLAGPGPALTEVVERLRGLAAGMRELSAGTTGR